MFAETRSRELYAWYDVVVADRRRGGLPWELGAGRGDIKHDQRSGELERTIAIYTSLLKSKARSEHVVAGSTTIILGAARG